MPLEYPYPVIFSNITESNEVASGAITVAGGAGIGKNLSVAGNVNVAKALNVTSGIVAPNMGMLRNRVINGAMRIDQRNNGALQTITSSSAYTLDRWRIDGAATGYTSQQIAINNAVAGFTHCWKVTTPANTSGTASQQFCPLQIIEGNNISDFGFGTANAQPVVVSFWVNCSIAGTFGVTLENYNGSIAYYAPYTVTAANTWQQFVIYIPACTSGTWYTDSSIGAYLIFALNGTAIGTVTTNTWYAGNPYFLASGGTNLLTYSAATWSVTGVQLEKGIVATPFEFRLHQLELQLCQRYYFRWVALEPYSHFASGGCTSATMVLVTYQFPVPLRTPPTVGTSGGFAILSNVGPLVTSIGLDTQSRSTTSIRLDFNTSGGMTTGYVAHVRSNGMSGYWIDFNAEY